MTPEQWAIIKDIVSGTLARPDAERDAYVESRTAGAPALAAEVRSLLESVTRAADLYETPQFVTPVFQAIAAREERLHPAAGDRIGAYRIVADIGRGGMGAAYLAERADGSYEKRVAIKLIKRGMDTDAILRRFHHERQILATLEHPNIVMLLDGGTTDDGLPYFVMEYVDGAPIDTYCDAHGLSIPRRLELFAAVCRAVQYAHAHQVVHRDLKPSNILVTSGGTPKLLDFGIAKVLDTADAQRADTATAGLVLTPQFASPEQIRGEPARPASDVYSLGVLLYVLLAGRHPYRLRGSRDDERIVCEDTPPLPSRAVDDEAAARRGESVDRLRSRLAGDLDAVVSRALAKDPRDRYPSADALAEDVERHLQGRPIVARRLARRRRVAAVAAMTAAVVLAALATVALRNARADDPLTGIRSIAVLPLAVTSGQADADYLADGIAEDIIRRLSRAGDLKVIAWTSTSRFRQTRLDPGEVAQQLGVDAVLTGSVAERGSDISIVTELVHATDRRRVWQGRYEGRSSDVQRAQRELTAQIVRSLRLPPASEQRALLDAAGTLDTAAYDLYLKGRFFWNKRTPAGLTRSAEYFERAVGRDPSFALAWSGLADAYGLLTEYHTLPATETYPRVRHAVTQALALDPSLAETQTSLAYLRQFYEWDWPGAEVAFRRALTLNPGYATGHQWYAEFLSASGRHDEALSEIRTAVSLDPVSLIVNAVEANLLYMAGRYDEAIAKSLQVIDLDPNFPEVYEYLKRSYDQTGRFAEAITARQARRRILGRDITVTAALRGATAATSAREYWRHRLTQELRESEDEGVQPFEFAEILAQAGDRSGALTWLERACRDHDFMTVYFRVAPNLRPLRGDPRFTAISQRGCPVSSSSTASAQEPQ